MVKRPREFRDDDATKTPSHEQTQEAAGAAAADAPAPVQVPPVRTQPFVLAATASWPSTTDVGELQAIIQEQADTVTANSTLIASYQAALADAQVIPPPVPPQGVGASAQMSSSATTAGLSGVTGIIQVPCRVVYAGTSTPNPIPPDLQLIAQLNGQPGSNGNYQMNQTLAIDAPGVNVILVPPPQAPVWPTQTDAPTLQAIVTALQGILRQQNGLITGYQNVLNLSQVAAPTSASAQQTMH